MGTFAREIEEVTGVVTMLREARLRRAAALVPSAEEAFKAGRDAGFDQVAFGLTERDSLNQVPSALLAPAFRAALARGRAAGRREGAAVRKRRREQKRRQELTNRPGLAAAVRAASEAADVPRVA